jgi:chromosome segregation ATPase
VSTFAENTWFSVAHCCTCGIAFAMTSDFERRRRNDHAWFYCPSGHKQHYTGPTEAQKLKAELDRKAEMLNAAKLRAETAEKDRQQIGKAHQRMRERVMNGVCPCCNRTFQNLMDHMKSEHPDFSDVRTMLTLRKAFGMTQDAVAREAGVDAPHVSLYERGRPVSPNAKKRLDAWLERHNSTAGKLQQAQDALPDAMGGEKV